MMERPIVSVIIPVYNVEDYIEKAVNSICSQTLTDWEMFLVDDGSTDSSGLLCDNLASNESRIHVIHQENQGAAAARNAALDLAQGKYLYFMDGDDWASADMLYDMVCLAENYYLDAWAGVPVNNRGRNLDSIGQQFRLPSEMTADVPEPQCAQMVIAGFYIETYYTDTECYIQKQSLTPAVYGAKSEFRDVAHRLFDRNLLYTVWNKLYLTSYIREQGIRFRDGHWDDFPFNLDVIRNVERVSVTDTAYYHFSRKRQDSESEKYNPGLYLEREQEHKNLLGLYEGWHQEVEEFLLEEMKKHQPMISQFDEPEERKQMGAPLADEIKTGAAFAAAQESEPQERQDLAVETKDADDAAAQDVEKADVTAEEDEKAGDRPEDQPEGQSDKSTTDKTEEQAGENAAEQAEEQTGESIAEQPEEPIGEKSDETPLHEEQGSESQNPDLLPGQLEPPKPVVNIPSPEAEEFISRRYLERIVGCIENIMNPECTLTKKEKRTEIKSILRSDSVREALKTAKPNSVYMKTMLVPLRMKSTLLTELEGKCISSVKRKNKKLFAKLKANR